MKGFSSLCNVQSKWVDIFHTCACLIFKQLAEQLCGRKALWGESTAIRWCSASLLWRLTMFCVVHKQQQRLCIRLWEHFTLTSGAQQKCAADCNKTWDTAVHSSFLLSQHCFLLYFVSSYIFHPVRKSTCKWTHANYSTRAVYSSISDSCQCLWSIISLWQQHFQLIKATYEAIWG